MCGIAAAVDWPAAGAAVGAVLEGLQHRGRVSDPIAEPFPGAALGTRRLPIVAEAGAAQPKASQDGRILLVLNGEIYNHRELRIALEAEGVLARTGSDTEVLADALQAWGSLALSRIRGMYAFVALDLRTREFLAARDPFGEKPLYVVEDGGRFLFSSEIRPLLAAVPDKDVLLLPAGHLLTRRGCRPAPRPAPAASETGTEDLDTLLRQAVRRCVPPDRPLALLFSGGVDSTLIAHYAQEDGVRARGYFLGDDQAPDYPYARAYAEASGLELRRVSQPAAPGAALAQVDAVVRSLEAFEPSVVRPSYCYFSLGAAVQEDGCDVVLTGEGADELFCGYGPLEAAYAHGSETGGFVRDQCLANLDRAALQRVDRMMMRFGVEARSPFLDADVAGLALRLDPGAFFETGASGALRGKAPLRALYDVRAGLPGMIRGRVKVPLNEGAGLDQDQKRSPLIEAVDARMTDAEHAEIRDAHKDFGLASKEEAYYFARLAAHLDVARVPHLKARLGLRVPAEVPVSSLSGYLRDPTIPGLAA